MVTAKYRIKQYQHLVESDDAVMNSCEEEIQKLESQIQDTSVNLDAIMSADSDAQKGQDDYKEQALHGKHTELLQMKS